LIKSVIGAKEFGKRQNKKNIYHFPFLILDFTFEEQPRDLMTFNLKSKITNGK